MKLLSTFILGFLFLVFSFTRASIQPDFVIEQENSINQLSATHTDLTLEKKPFTISFNCKAYTDSAFNAVRLGIFLDKSQIYKVKSGMSVDDVAYFSLGTGYATDGPYDPFFINTEDAGHHYISFKKDGEQRAELVSENDNGVLRLKCHVNNLCIDGETFPIEKTDVKALYLVLFYDNNLNGVLGSDEFRTVAIDFNESGKPK